MRQAPDLEMHEKELSGIDTAYLYILPKHQMEKKTKHMRSKQT